MPTILVLAIICVFLCCGTCFLSTWLNRLYAESPDVLSFPDKAAPQPFSRAAKILTVAFVLLYIKAFPPAVLSAHFTVTPFQAPVQIAFFAAFLAFALIFFSSDMEQQVIFDKQLLLFAACGIAHSWFIRGQFVEPALLALGSGILFLLFAILTRGGIGGGDIKLIAALALWGGISEIQFTVVYGILLGGVWSLYALLIQRKSRKSFIPYGPPLIVAAVLAYM